MTPDPEHLVALALTGCLPLKQTEEILASVEFVRPSTMKELALAQRLNEVCKRLRKQAKLLDGASYLPPVP